MDPIERFEQSIVTEWRTECVDYKAGEKLIRAAQKAVILEEGNGRSQSSANFDHNKVSSPITPRSFQRAQMTWSFKHTSKRRAMQVSEAIEATRSSEVAFFDFLGQELIKVEAFYHQQEAVAGLRLDRLGQQIQTINNIHCCKSGQSDSIAESSTMGALSTEKDPASSKIPPRQNATDVPYVQILEPHGGATSDAGGKMIEDNTIQPSCVKAARQLNQPAKRKLRVGLQEIYRGLENVKAYCLINQSAFQILLKKYEQVTESQHRSDPDWAKQYLDSADFTRFEQVEIYTELTEKLYANCFVKGNRKQAVDKLRMVTIPPGDKSGSALINGLLVGVGLVAAVEGTWNGIEMLASNKMEVRLQTSFLLQLYAGYFLLLYLFTWFCINCRIWKSYRINYSFVFEFDERHNLDWRQLANFPSGFWLLGGGCIWLNFWSGWKRGQQEFFLWFPVFMFSVAAVVLFAPLPILRWRSRRWFAISHWRLLCSGFYPVEFRDIFLADTYCSLIYSVANAEMFFCLYIGQWQRPITCSSKQSRLFGFLLALPPIWRSLQCLRRYWDSKDIFPHLMNLLKYVFVIVAACMLSRFRIDHRKLHLSLYVIFASIASIYGALWDIMLDFSLLQHGAQHTGLRQVLAFGATWPYYTVIVVDLILRFCWVPLVIFTHHIQHGSWVTFLVAVMEATRRGLWMLFRMENEHCANFANQRVTQKIFPPSGGESQGSGGIQSFPSSAQVEPTVDVPPVSGSLAATATVLSRQLATAHRYDHVKAKRNSSFEDAEAQRRAEDCGIDVYLQDEVDSDENDETEDVVHADRGPVGDEARK